MWLQAAGTGWRTWREPAKAVHPSASFRLPACFAYWGHCISCGPSVAATDTQQTSTKFPLLLWYPHVLFLLLPRGVCSFVLKFGKLHSGQTTVSCRTNEDGTFHLHRKHIHLAEHNEPLSPEKQEFPPF